MKIDMVWLPARLSIGNRPLPFPFKPAPPMDGGRPEAHLQ
jgi:hypothetical protein